MNCRESGRAAQRRGHDQRVVPTQLKREKVQLQKKLQTAELMLDLQKKVSQILGITLPVLEESDDDEVNS